MLIERKPVDRHAVLNQLRKAGRNERGVLALEV
jgi:hypothetical protein